MADGWNVYQRPKPAGGFRLIEEPPEELKKKQKGVNSVLNRLGVGPGKWSTGFVRGKSIVDNALPHYGRKYVIEVDLKDAFHNVKEMHLKSALSAENVPKHIIDEVTELSLYKGRLPMGAPSSPNLLNIALKHFLDPRIAGLVKKLDGTYTRYADNIAISSDNPKVVGALKSIRNIVEDIGMKLRHDKTKIMRPGRRQKITGLVINRIKGEDQPRVRIPKARRRAFRAKLHNAKMAAMRGENPRINYRKAYGHVAFFNMVHPDYGRWAKAELKTIRQLENRRKWL